MTNHLAIFVGSTTEDILSGRKTIEVRLSKSNTLPFCSVMKNDLIFLKKSGGCVVGQVVVDNVLYYENLNPESIEFLKRKYSQEITVKDNFWLSKKNSKYGTLIFLKKPKRFTIPLKFHKRDRRPWVLLDK